MAWTFEQDENEVEDLLFGNTKTKANRAGMCALILEIAGLSWPRRVTSLSGTTAF